MKKTVLRIGFLMVMLVSGLLIASPQTAIANDSVNKVADIFDIASYVPGFPISGQEIRDSYELFDCIDAGTDPAKCLSTFHDKPVGQKAAAETGIPSWFWNLLDGYIALKESDYWGVVYYFGEAVICAAAQVLAMGVDVCALIQELIQLGKDLWNAAVAVVEFLKDCGKAILDAACWIGLGGCSEKTPPAVTVYVDYFAPILAQGLAAREAYVDGLEALIAQRKVDAFKDPTDDLSVASFTDASNLFRNTVNGLWDGDLLKTVLPALSDKRLWYDDNKKSSMISSLASEAVTQNDPSMWIYNRCAEDFRKTFSFAHVDRWLAISSSDVNLKAIKTQTKNNSAWCSDFEYKHRNKEFKLYFEEYVGKNLCPKVGNKFVCPSADTKKSCVKIMGSISYEAGQQCVDKPPCPQAGAKFQCGSLNDFKACMKSVGDTGLCGVDFSAAAQELAGMIDKSFKDNGSESCPYGGFDFAKSGTPNKPVDFICSRPTQQAWCNKKYDEFLGVSLPFKFVNCGLSESKEYANLRARVAQVVAILKKGGSAGLHPQGGAVTINQSAVGAAAKSKGGAGTSGSGGKVGIVENASLCGNWADLLGPDPLIVSAEACVVNRVKGDANQNFGFGKPSMKPGFNYDLQGINPIDGASTPVLLEAAHTDPQKMREAAKKSLEDQLKTGITPEDTLKKVIESGGKPGGNPIDQLSPEKLKGTSPILESKKTADAKILGATEVNLQGEKQQAPAGKIVTPAAGKLNAAPMAAPAQTPGAPQPTPMSLQYPDLTAADSATVAGKTQRQNIPWNTPVTIDAKDAVSIANGMCTFTVQYALRNLANGAAGSFKSAWTNSATMQTVERTWAGIAPGATSAPVSDSLSLKPGQNPLTLDIDKGGLVKEVNETNNQFRVTVNVTGSCSATAVTADQPGAPVSPKMPPAPQPQRGPAPPLRR
jgi:hypothetical protein